MKKIFEAPGPGSWELDATHFQKPISRYISAVFEEPLMRGFKLGTERFGLLFSHMLSFYIHGFSYSRPVLAFVPEDAPPGPPPEGFFEQPELVARFDRGVKAIEQKLWREDLRLWDEEVKPDSIRRNRELQSVTPESLEPEQLIKHLIDCRDNLGEMWFRHHQFTIPSILPTGLYLAKVCQWTGLDAGDVLSLLKGSSSVSKGLAAAELGHIARLLKQREIEPERFSQLRPEEALSTLRTMPDPIGSAVENYLDIVGYQLTSGYDITERYALEMPELLVASICSEMTRAEALDDKAEFEQRRQSIRSQVPAEHQGEFDELLDEARLINRLRDERGVYNEAKAIGLARRAILEGGSRMQAQGRLSDANLLLHASHEEMLAMLGGKNEPAEGELQERADWYQSKTTDDAPPFLGPPPEPTLPLAALPENARLAEAAFGAALGNIFDAPVAEPEAAESIKGYPVSPGIYEGTARIIQNPADFRRLQAGDVLITRNTSAAFNVVLPMLGAIVTDRGGQLSHAAIVAREYGVPGIVSTRNATRLIPDGARVRVDGASGEVEILS